MHMKIGSSITMQFPTAPLHKRKIAVLQECASHEKQAIKTTTRQDTPLKNEVNDGFIYLYKVPGNDNLVKIGFNTDSVDVRVKTWRKKCHREAHVLHATDSRERVPHAHRVERLVHAELMERRVRHYCERCTAQHVEWFEAEVEEAAAVMDKWSCWMRTRPEQRRMTRQNHSAGSRSEMRCDICMLVKPLDEFRKNSRRNGEYQCRRCDICMLVKPLDEFSKNSRRNGEYIQEPSLTPGPLETGHSSPEEEQQQTLRQRFVMSQDFFHDDDLVPQ
ncbi:hypothetical protein G3M48_008557, partial [Beauveria asiatica]